MHPIARRLLGYSFALGAASLSCWSSFQILYAGRYPAVTYPLRHGINLGAIVLLLLFAMEVFYLQGAMRLSRLLFMSSTCTGMLYAIWHILLMA